MQSPVVTPGRYPLRSQSASSAPSTSHRSIMSFELESLVLSAGLHRNLSRVYCILSVGSQNRTFFSQSMEKQENGSQIVFRFSPDYSTISNIPASKFFIPRLLVYSETESGAYLGEATAILASSVAEGNLPVIVNKHAVGQAYYRTSTIEENFVDDSASEISQVSATPSSLASQHGLSRSKTSLHTRASRSSINNLSTIPRVLQFHSSSQEEPSTPPRADCHFMAVDTSAEGFPPPLDRTSSTHSARSLSAASSNHRAGVEEGREREISRGRAGKVFFCGAFLSISLFLLGITLGFLPFLLESQGLTKLITSPRQSLAHAVKEATAIVLTAADHPHRLERRRKRPSLSIDHEERIDSDVSEDEDSGRRDVRRKKTDAAEGETGWLLLGPDEVRVQWRHTHGNTTSCLAWQTGTLSAGHITLKPCTEKDAWWTITASSQGISLRPALNNKCLVIRHPTQSKSTLVLQPCTQAMGWKLLFHYLAPMIAPPEAELGALVVEMLGKGRQNVVWVKDLEEVDARHVRYLEVKLVVPTTKPAASHEWHWQVGEAEFHSVEVMKDVEKGSNDAMSLASNALVTQRQQGG